MSITIYSSHFHHYFSRNYFCYQYFNVSYISISISLTVIVDYYLVDWSSLSEVTSSVLYIYFFRFERKDLRNVMSILSHMFLHGADSLFISA